MLKGQAYREAMESWIEGLGNEILGISDSHQIASRMMTAGVTPEAGVYVVLNEIHKISVAVGEMFETHAAAFETLPKPGTLQEEWRRDGYDQCKICFEMATVYRHTEEELGTTWRVCWGCAGTIPLIPLEAVTDD